MQKIADGIYTLDGLFVGRVYIIVGSDGLTMIDATVPGAVGKITSELGKIGRQLSEIKRILITHAHPDHIGSLAAVQKLTGAQVYVHPRDAAATRGDEPITRPDPKTLTGLTKFLASALPNPKMDPSPVHREIVEGDKLDEVLPGFTLVETPGHSPGQVAFWYPSLRLMFCGDTVGVFDRMRLPIAPATVDMAQAKRSIRKIADMDIDILCFGHGKPMIGNASAALRVFATKVGV
ncbi:MAG: MBL fold metallo-hydrolase [Anaerolineae bacterium]|nr:MBL fold metallo-hydrolase [Anaerolineae bacterium]